MSTQEYSGTMPENTFMSVEEGRKFYDLSERDSLFASPLDQALVERGIARVALSVTDSDFESFLDAYAECIDAYPKLLQETSHAVDSRYAFTAGHVRKEKKIDPITGAQTNDPKSLIHFNEKATLRWQEQFTAANSPLAFRQFLAMGADLQLELAATGRAIYGELEETHPNIQKAFFPIENDKPVSFGFLRGVIYDGYAVSEASSALVAKPHTDVSGGTLHGYTDKPGFMALINGEWIAVDTEPGFGYFFVGDGHEKLYGENCRIKAVEHRVDRITPLDADYIGPRRTVVNFNNTPYIDYANSLQDTAPQAVSREQAA